MPMACRGSRGIACVSDLASTPLIRVRSGAAVFLYEPVNMRRQAQTSNDDVLGLFSTQAIRL